MVTYEEINPTNRHEMRSNAIRFPGDAHEAVSVADSRKASLNADSVSYVTGRECLRELMGNFILLLSNYKSV